MILRELFSLDKRIEAGKRNVTGELFTPNAFKLRNCLDEKNSNAREKISINFWMAAIALTIAGGIGIISAIH